MSNGSGERDRFALRIPIHFVRAAIDNGWFPPVLIKELISLISEYVCCGLNEWCVPAVTRLSVSGLVTKRSSVSGLDSIVTCDVDVVGFGRAWSVWPIGGGGGRGGGVSGGDDVPPYFGVRVSGLISAGTAAVLIGLSTSRQKPDTPYVSYGVTSTQIAVMSCRQGVPAPPPASGVEELDGWCAVSDHCIQSHILSADPDFCKPAPSDGVPPERIQTDARTASRAAWKHNGSVIGVSCDLAANELTFYVNDQPMCATPYVWNTQKFDKTRALPSQVGAPFVWKAPFPLAGCHVFLSCFASSLRAEFVEWTPPHLRVATASTAASSKQ